MDFSQLVLIIPWGIFVGIVFSAIGAAGGILTTFGLISLFAVADPNSIKPMTQIVVLATALSYVPGYFRRSAIVLPLGLLLGGGGLLGAYFGSTISSLYLSDMATFRPLFGILTLAIAAQILWTLFRDKDSNSTSSGDFLQSAAAQGVCDTEVTKSGLKFSHCGTHYAIPIWQPLAAGFIISMTASIFGVGGGFLLVPFMVSVLKMPMHIIPATAAIAIFMSLAVSISNFLARGAPLHFDILIPLIIGTILGAFAGPVINRSLKNTWLQGALAVIVVGIGLRYTLF